MAELIQLTREAREEVESQRRAAEQRPLRGSHLPAASHCDRRKSRRPSASSAMPGACPSTSAGSRNGWRWISRRPGSLLPVGQRANRRERGAVRGADREERPDRHGRHTTLPPEVPEQGHQYWLRRAGQVDLIANCLLAPNRRRKRAPTAPGRRENSLAFTAAARPVYADSRDEFAYFTTAFDLILSLHQLPPNSLRRGRPA